MKIPYTIIHTPKGYQLDVDTRTAVMNSINLSVEAPSRVEAIALLSQDAVKELRKMGASKWPEEADWMPGDAEIEVNP